MSTRVQKVEALLQRELAKLIHAEMKDPRLKFITISHVKVSGDLSYGKVYITVLDNSDENIKNCLDVLNKAKGFIRKQIGRILKLRIVPQLSFVYDKSVQYGSDLHQLIDDVIAKEDERD